MAKNFLKFCLSGEISPNPVTLDVGKFATTLKSGYCAHTPVDLLQKCTLLALLALFLNFSLHEWHYTLHPKVT